MENVASVQSLDAFNPMASLRDIPLPDRGQPNVRTFVITNNGILYGWGTNTYGQLGVGTSIDSNLPLRIMENVSSVYTSAYNTFAITTDNILYGWGNNEHGVLGNGTTTDSNVPIRIMENVTTTYIGINNIFAITADSTLYAWGRNGRSRFNDSRRYSDTLGDGTTYDRLNPTKVMENVSSVHLDRWIGASFLLTSDGNLYGWGDNGHGIIGDGTVNHSLYPVRVMDNVLSIFNNGGFDIYAITIEGNFYAWGGHIDREGYRDRFGRGKSPIRIMEGVRYFDNADSLLLLDDDSLWVFSTFWTDPIIPRRIKDSVRSVMVGDGGVDNRYSRIYAITTDGNLWTWIHPRRLENQRHLIDESDPLYKPTLLLDAVVSVHPGDSWRFSDNAENDQLAEIMLELFASVGLSLDGEGGSYVITDDGNLWRIGNHEPFVVLDSIISFCTSITKVNIAIQADGSTWAWSDSRTFLHSNDPISGMPTLVGK